MLAKFDTIPCDQDVQGGGHHGNDQAGISYQAAPRGSIVDVQTGRNGVRVIIGLRPGQVQTRIGNGDHPVVLEGFGQQIIDQNGGGFSGPE